MAKVLVTGSAGAVGRQACRELLSRGHQLRGLDRIPTPGLGDVVVADITDAERVRASLRGFDVVVHLAAEPHDPEFVSGLVGPNVVGVYNVLHAARQESVPRVILASSLQVAPERLGRPARVDEAAPRNHYALTKLWAEEMGEMYARCFGLHVLCARMTWMVRGPGEARHMDKVNRQDIYLSNHDAGRFFGLAVQATWMGFAVVYVASLGCEALFDMEPARRIVGYVARDRWPEGLAFKYPDDEDQAPTS